MTRLPEIPTSIVGGVPIAVIDRARSATLMVEEALARRGTGADPLYMTSANGQVLAMCAGDPTIRAAFLRADLIHADSTPLVLASRLKARRPLPERASTADLFHDVARVAEARGAGFYLLGGTAEVMERASAAVMRRYPALAMVGCRHGYISAEEEASSFHTAGRGTAIC